MSNTENRGLPQTASDFKQLQSLVDTLTTTRNRHRMSRQLATLKQASQRGKVIDRDWEKWHTALLSNQAELQQRSESLPKFSFPDLPVSARADEIAALIQKHQVIVVAGETGSGKTTQLPKICLQAGRGVRGLIGHTQPRRIAARTVANRIAEELQVEVGGAVGYQVRFSEQTSPDSYIKLMTDGILLAEIQHDRFLSKYDTLIIDEAHERSLNIDFLLGYFKKLLPQRPDLKIIITSATIDVEKFSNHFDGAPIVEVTGRSFPVTFIYKDPDDVDSDRDQTIVNCVQDIQAHEKPGDILIFLSGEREIREVNLALKRAQLPHTEVVPLYARLSLAEQSKIFSPHRGCRIVLSTNVAETSLTVPGIRYVVDTGRARISRYSFRTKVQRLPIEPISQASANQRAGRCGRVSEGVCYRLYGEDDFNARAEFTDPEIVRTNLAAVILQMLHLKIGDIRNFPFVDAPDSRMISDGFKLLEELQAVTADGQLSPLGKRMVNIPLDPRFSRMLLESAKNSCLAEVLIIATGLSIQDPRERPADKQQAADQCHKQWQDPESDFISLLNLWRHFEEQRQTLSSNQFSRYCKSNYVSYLRMREWRDLHHQIHSACRDLKLTDNTQPSEPEAVHRSLLAGLLGQIGMLQEKWEYLGTRNRKFFIFPGSGVSKKPPKWLMAGSLMETTKQFALDVAKIDSDWLEPLAAHLVNKTYSEPFYSVKSGQVMAKERQTLFGLTIVENKNRVYGQVAPDEARSIFIQQALVEEGYRGKGHFYQHNQQLVEELQALEDRFRRRDLLAEQQVIFAFYNERVPADIYNLVAFEKWRKQAEAEQPKLLFLEKEYLLLRGLSQDEQAQFPESVECDGVNYPLQYHFEPSHSDDGVSVVLPLPLLHQLPKYFFEWLVPGMLRDKCIALVKSLPKQTRRNFVPVPDYVDGFLAKEKAQDRPLTERLGEHLQRVTGVSIAPEHWNSANLDPWYQMNFILEDERGNVVAKARSLEKLQLEFKQQISRGLEKAADKSASRQGITEWDFNELPQEVALAHGKMTIKAWPALRDCGESVALEVIDNPLQAERLSRDGQLRLMLLKGREQVKYLSKQLLRGKELALTASKIGERQSIVDALIRASFQQALFPNGKIVRDKEQFEQAFESGIGQVVSLAQGYGLAIESLLTPLHAAQKQLRTLGLPAIYAAEDIRQQIDWLFSVDTLAAANSEVIAQYPRYVKAIQVRLEKVAGQPSKDREYIAELHELLAPCKLALVEDQPLPLEIEGALRDFTWLVEEYRVSLFAQQLKTRVPVSLKRLQKRWQEIDDQLRRVRI